MHAASIQHTSSYEEDKLFLSHSYSSKEDFSKEYRIIYQGKPKCQELYFVIVMELQAAIRDGEVANFKHFCKLIDYINDIKSPTPIKTAQFTDPIKVNLVILACKHNRVEILKYIFNDARVFEKVSIFSGKDAIVPEDKDEMFRGVFYYAVRSSNVKLLDLLITKWPGNYFVSRSLELDEILSRAYELLKLQNVSLSDEMEIFVENKLINLRFFSNPHSQVQSAKDSLCSIGERINLVLKSIALLKSEYSNDEKVDSKFLFVGRFIAQNIQILKRRLKFSYDRLPWEEIEFCLVAFVSSHLKQQEINLFYRAILSKNKILLYLENFAKTLADLKPFVGSLDMSKLAKLPKLNREQAVETIIRNDPQFSKLYNDYQQIRDIYSLERVSDYLNLALSTDPKEREGQIIITRALQVIGEYFKNTLESPNLSSTTSELLLFSLPKNTRKIIVDLRNSLSHAYSLSQRTEIYENSDANFFIGIQNDTKRIDNVIIDILFKKRIKMIVTLLKEIIDSESVNELMTLAEILSSIKLEKVISHDFKMMELENIEKLVQQLSDAITDQTIYEKELFDKMKGIISSTKTKSNTIRADYSATLAMLTSLSVALSNIAFDDSSIRGIKFCANKALMNFIPQVESQNLKEIAEFSMIISRNATSRMQDEEGKLDAITGVVYKICYIVEFEIDDMKWVEKLRKKLHEKGSSLLASKQNTPSIMTKNKYDKQLTDKLSELKTILTKDLSSGKLIDYKQNKKLQAVVEMLVLDIMSILGGSEKHLENNLLFLDDNTPILTGKSLRNHLAHGNTLLEVLLSDPSLAVVSNAEKLVSENIVKSKKKVGKFVKDDPSKLNLKFDQDLKTIINQENMFAALANGNLEELKNYLENGADITAKSIRSSTALHFAAQGSNLELVKFIVDQNIPVDVKDANGQTPLHIAAAHGKKDIIEFFLTQASVLINNPDKQQRTPLHIAAKNGHEDTVEILLKHNANTDIKDISGYSPLHCAVRNNHINVVRILLKVESNADINEVIGGSTSLHIAAEFGFLELVDFLLENGAKVDAKNYINSTPLHSAVINGHLKVVNVLILKGADVNAKVLDGCTPLHYAVENGYEEVANVLLEHEAKVDAIDKTYNYTPLSYAAKYGHEQLVETLLIKGANANIATKVGITPLHFAARNGHLKIVTSLLKQGVDIHARDRRSYTALHYAAENGHEEIAKLLIANGAVVDSTRFKNFTPLHLAAIKGHEHVVDFLIKNGAKICNRDIMGNTALFTAAVKGHKGVIDILLKNKAKVNSKSHDGKTPLHVTALFGHYDVIVFLVESGADVNAKDNDGHTPLYAAIFKGHVEIINFLIDNGARVNVESVCHRTPLNVAVEAGRKEVVEILIANGAKVNLGSHCISSAIRGNNKEMVEVLIANGADVNEDGGKPLLLAVHCGFHDIVELLLNNRARVNIKGPRDYTPLHLAAEEGRVEIVNSLISRGALVNAKTTSFATPLSMAVQAGHAEVAEILLSNGAKSTDFDYPLHEAAVKGHANVVDVLLRNGADMYMEDYEGRTALELAVGHGHLPVVKLFMQHKKVFLEDRGTNGVTLLLIAAQEDNFELVKYLVEKGANIRATNATGSNCLHIAAREGFQDAVEFFLDKGLEVNAPGANNQTPLHYTAMKNRVEVAKYLISKGANVNSKDLKGFTPMHMAALFGYKDIVEVLLKNGAVFNDIDYIYGKSPLEMASSENVVCNDMFLRTPCSLRNKNDVINLLSSTEKLFDAVKRDSSSDVQKFIKAGAFIDAKHTGTEATPLHYASWKGFDDIVKILLENKANPNSTCDKGFTALHYAAKFSRLNCVKILMSHGAIYNSVSESGKTPLKLTKDKGIIDLIKITDASFKNIENNNDRIINDLNKVNASDLKAIMNARNRESRSLIAAALQSNFELAEKLKHISQADSHYKLYEAVEFMNRGDYQRSLSMLKCLLEKRKQLLGPDNPSTLDMQTYIAKVLNQQGDYNKALGMLEEIFQKQMETLGLNNKDTLDTRSTIALVLYRLGRDSEAFDIYKEVYQKQKKVLGPTDENTVNTQFHMALVLHALGQYEEALNINRAVLEIKKKTLGSRHINTVVVQNNIAMVLSGQGKYEEALKMFKEVYEIKKEIIGTNHTDTLRTLNSIAGILVKQNKFQEGLMAFEELLAMQKKTLQQNHPEILNTQYNIANVLFAQGKYVHAFKVFKECHDRRKNVFGPYHPSVLDAYKKMEMICNFKFKIDGFNPDEVLQQLQKEINVASSNGDMRTVKRLLENGTDVNDTDTDGRTPLHFAVNNGDLAMVNLLLKNGASVTVVTNKGNTPLHTAASKNYEKIVRVLLQHVDKDELHDFVNAKTTSDGTTSLHVAAKGGYLEIVRLLLKNGATYDIPNKEDKTPVDLATDQKVVELFKLIDELFKLVKKGSVEAIDKLKTMAPDEFEVVTNARCSQGHGLLQVAIVNAHTNVACAFLAMLKKPN